VVVHLKGRALELLTEPSSKSEPALSLAFFNISADEDMTYLDLLMIRLLMYHDLEKLNCDDKFSTDFCMCACYS